MQSFHPCRVRRLRPPSPAALACFGLWLALGTATSLAAATPAQPAAPGAAVSDSANPAETPPIAVEGFRSARFGMTEDDVRKAIVKDFGIKPDAIKPGENPAERTQLLTVLVPDLLPDGGTAQVSYVFGYKSKALIQVGASWSRATDDKITEAELYADGDILRQHFLTAGYKPDTIKTGLVLQNGILLFRGEDEAGRATILLLQGQFADGADGKRVLTPSSLALLYSADPAHPDVFKLAPGQF